MDDIGRLRPLARIEQANVRVSHEGTRLCGAIAPPEEFPDVARLGLCADG